ncbi:hypothetical protein AQ750_04650 [Burkholderia pseudomallei]|nr:hypothetical protein AQ736_03370 [Burkholderia pseudomallei]OMS96429.1 hypothetical protein AQ750_04650 [Burkholderia pseudomallei]OMV27164.1 hypothetical protein AQ787_14170 [Burkholderia pseudomallei]
MVAGERSIKDSLDRKLATPYALVIYAGDKVLTGKNGVADLGRVQAVEQKWHIEIVVNNQTDYVGGTGERVEAGTLIAQVLSALSGYRLSPLHRELRRVNAPAVLHSPPYGYFPLAFTTEIVTQ